MYPSGAYEFLVHFFCTILYQFFKWLVLAYTCMYYGITDITPTKDAVLPETSSASSSDLCECVNVFHKKINHGQGSSMALQWLLMNHIC